MNYGNQMSQFLSSVIRQARQSGSGGHIKGVADRNGVGGVVILPHCRDWGEAVREFAEVPIGADCYFWYRARLAIWPTLLTRALTYRVEFEFVLR